MAALGGVGLWACVNGIGKSLSQLAPGEVVVNAKLIVASDVCWLLGSVFVKLSIVCLYHRVFATPQFRRWSWALLSLISIYGVAFIVVYLTNCTPVDQLWNPQPGGHCRDPRDSDYATLAINLFLDLAILVLPMPSLWGLRLAVRKKVIITIMFSLGIGTIIVMLYRLVFTVQVRDDPDFTVHLAALGIVTGLEVWFGIIIACIPTLAPLVKPIINSFKTTSGSGDSVDTVPLPIWNKKRVIRNYDHITNDSQTRLSSLYGGIHQTDVGPLSTTEVSHNPDLSVAVIGSPNAIYVQNQFGSHD